MSIAFIFKGSPLPKLRGANGISRRQISGQRHHQDEEKNDHQRHAMTSRKSIYQPRCLDLAADGAFRGIILGVAWSASFRQFSTNPITAMHSISTREDRATPQPTASTPPKNKIRSTANIKVNAAAARPTFFSTVDGMLQFADNKTQRVRSSVGKAWSFTPPTLRHVAGNTAAFSVFIGVFNGTLCASERLRKRTDWVNPFFAGFSASLVFGLRNPSIVRCMSTCLATGAFTAGFHVLQNIAGSKKT